MLGSMSECSPCVLTSPRNWLSSSRTRAWSHTVSSNIRSLNSRRWTGEYMKVWFHRGSTDFFTVFVLRLLLSLWGEETINSQSQSFCSDGTRQDILQVHESENTDEEPEGNWEPYLDMSFTPNHHLTSPSPLNSDWFSLLPSVWQEVDLDIGVPRSAVVPDRKFFGSENGDDQLMTDFVVPQLQL